MNIQWYPGHMHKTKRQIQENLRLVDVVIEVTDARIPQSGRNPDIKEIHNKPYILAITKVDLADPKRTDMWQNFYRQHHEKFVLLNLLSGQGINQIKRELQVYVSGIKRKPRILIVGIPNVGKSSLINRLAKKKHAKVGAKPGITRGKQWINAGSFQILDTPGILWPKFDDQVTAKKLVAVAAIKDEIIDSEEVAYWLLSFLAINYPHLLYSRYGISNNAIDAAYLMETIGTKRGCLGANNVIDVSKTAHLVLKDFRTGLIGRITLERPHKEG